MISVAIAFIFSSVLFAKEKFSSLGLFYLSFLLLFFPDKTRFLLFCLYSQVFRSTIFLKNPRFTFFLFLAVLTMSIVQVKPRLGLDMGLINSINAQRGEHVSFETNLIARLIHNKSELVHSFISNFDKLLSPAAIFASGFWHQLSPYYPLGYLLPWDIYFLFYRFFRHGNVQTSRRLFYFFVPALVTLLLLTGLAYIDQAIFFAFGVLYFLAILAAAGYSTISKKAKVVFFFINTFFLLYQLAVSPYFKI